MSAYLNLLTNEYPLYPGDMQLRFSDFDELNPPENYVVVPDKDPPAADDNFKIQEVFPVLVDGVWVKQFVSIPLTPEEIALNDELFPKRRQSNNSSGSAPNVIG